MKIFRTLALAAAAAALALGAQAQTPASAGAPPADPAATPATKLLLANLHRLVGRGVMFGHQDDLAYGVDQGKMWKGDANRSDVKTVTGSYPAVFGWELGHVELDSARNLDGVPFARIQGYIKQAYAQGSVVTISWHLNNPHNGKTAWDTARTVKYILPGGPDHAKYVSYLDRVATFMGGLKGGKGEAIPVIFRPFHEHTGSWFWWGQKECTPAEFKAIWQFTVNYLHNEKKLHNLIIAYSAADFATEADYLERYPGDEYVDVMGFDAYCDRRNVARFQQDLDQRMTVLETVAKAHRKLPALTEFGFEGLPDPTWWTKVLLPALQKYPVSYALTWRNGDPVHYFVPFPGQASAADFKAFSQDKKVLFENRIAPLHLYSKPI
ncbi:glycoside hydrolase family 26 protein [Hymenobacter caeli]|uniref:Mannan endo-1,4-beta-mannosidase n=1 Tax=Hymenobacter caeli TaxID=2735894 RepID=A0ABX2FR18_9BACT|nr:glycosyl hydrolase [Hymenobacter caeli]NRT19436.1 mannan endo-1,4-beta-mannosidase [Hymenobacter caeli]